jgi:hypothetical protein
MAYMIAADKSIAIRQLSARDAVTDRGITRARLRIRRRAHLEERGPIAAVAAAPSRRLLVIPRDELLRLDTSSSRELWYYACTGGV